MTRGRPPSISGGVLLEPQAWAQSAPTVRVAGSFNGTTTAQAGHPIIQGPKDPTLSRVWGATCRIATNRGTGSGFFVQGPRWYAVTCAHVVDGCDHLTVERVIGGSFIESFSGRVVALDYSHDLAVVEYDVAGSTLLANFPIPELPLGESPPPGSSILTCGYPAGVDTPRLATGMVSGYDSFNLDGVHIIGPVLDASINGGNSGGPVVLIENGQPFVVGIISARPSTAPMGLEVDDELLRTLARVNANNGIGFALDPKDVQGLLATHNVWTRRTNKREYRQYEPRVVPIDKSDFIAVQVQCRDLAGKDESRSPIGVFSFSTKGDLHLGWYDDSDRVRIDAPGWKHVLNAVSGTGGSFVLRGTEVLLYRQKYRGYIVPVRVDIR